MIRTLLTHNAVVRLTAFVTGVGTSEGAVCNFLVGK